MSGIRTSTGLLSGIDFEAITEVLVAEQQRAVQRLELRQQNFEATKQGLSAIETYLIQLTTSSALFKSNTIFESISADNNDSDQLRVTVDDNVPIGTLSFQALRKASGHQVISKGFANTDQQTVGAGTLTIASGGFLETETLLETFNGGSGVRRGSIKVTDRSGQSSIIDLSNAITASDVVDAINNQSSISVRASVVERRFVLEDLTGSTAADLSVSDVDGGHLAEDLSLNKSVAADSLSGNDVYEVTTDFQLRQLNDGNQVRLLEGAPDIEITLRDDSSFEVNLDGSITLGDVVNKINNHEDNAGKVEASVVDGRLVLTDLTGGPNTLSVEDINGANVIQKLGLDATASADVLTGNKLAAGINSVLLRNLRGGQGIDQTGQISLTDRTGRTTTIDLTGAESLDEVLHAINTAEDGGGDRLSLYARVNANGNGLTIEDTSGATTSNLIVTDVGGSTLAAQLGIEIDAAENSVDSGSLNLRHINESSDISLLSQDGKDIRTGLFQITDTDGNIGVISITSAVTNIGDLIERINNDDDIKVTAALNETGDGLVLIDEAGGTGTLTVEEFDGGSIAEQLGLLGEGVAGGDGKERISSRASTIIEIESDDTLDDVLKKINETSRNAIASVVNDGSQFNSFRLSISSEDTGAKNRLLIDDGGIGLSLQTLVEASDAVLRFGSDPASAFLLTSDTNRFTDVSTGVDVEILQESDTPAEIAISRNTETVFNTVSDFVESFNRVFDTMSELTKFDLEAEERGILQGNSLALRTSLRLTSLVSVRIGPAESAVRSLSDLGISFSETGKLLLDESRLGEVLADNLEDAQAFFASESNGFGQQLEDLIDGFTDLETGSFTYEKESLDANVASLADQIEQISERAERERERLLLQFVGMEQALGEMQVQQQALANLQALAPSGLGI